MDYSRIRETLGETKVTTKWCRGCKEVKSLSDFYNRPGGGELTRCKVCHRGN